MHACKLAGLNHSGYRGLVCLPVGEEYAGCTGARQHECIGCKHIAVEFIGVAVGVVIVDEGHGILRIAEVDEAGGLIGCAVGLPCQLAHVIGAESLVERVFEGEVECCGSLSGGVDPRCQRIVAAIPVFAHGEFDVVRLIVHLGVLAAVALGEVITHAGIAVVRSEALDVGLAVFLHVSVGVVQIAGAVPMLAGVIVARGCSLTCLTCHFIVAADAFRPDAVGLALPCLGGEVGPVALAAAVVDDHIGDYTHALAFEGRDHAAELIGGAEGGIVVGEPVHRVVAHRGSAFCLCGIGHPDKREIV